MWPPLALCARSDRTQARAAAQALCDDPTRPVVVIGDGAEWIKKEAGRHFPQGTCILDWAYLWREVRQAILAVRSKAFGVRVRNSHRFLQRTRLWPGLALQGFHDLATGLPTGALQPVREAIRYLEHQRPWMGSYENWKAPGSSVGSGVIERAI